MKKRIYLASPYGFSTQQKERLLPPFVRIMENMGAEVWEPFARNSQADVTDAGWAFRVGQDDVRDLTACDAIFAIVNGTPPDEGVMVELGMAIALGKQVFLFRDDLRRCTDSERYPLNLMIFTGLPEVGWEDYYFTSMEEIPSPRKALARWLGGALTRPEEALSGTASA